MTQSGDYLIRWAIGYVSKQMFGRYTSCSEVNHSILHKGDSTLQSGWKCSKTIFLWVREKNLKDQQRRMRGVIVFGGKISDELGGARRQRVRKARFRGSEIANKRTEGMLMIVCGEKKWNESSGIPVGWLCFNWNYSSSNFHPFSHARTLFFAKSWLSTSTNHTTLGYSGWIPIRYESSGDGIHSTLVLLLLSSASHHQGDELFFFLIHLNRPSVEDDSNWAQNLIFDLNIIIFQLKILAVNYSNFSSWETGDNNSQCVTWIA